MTKTLVGMVAGLVAVSIASAASANIISITKSFRAPSATEKNSATNPAPAGGGIHSIFVTTDSDILAIENVQIVNPAGLPLFNHPFGDGANANRHNDLLVPAFPSLSADSWFDTPGNTSRLGADLPGDGVTTFGDLDNNGPQTNFQMAQLCFTNAAGAGEVRFIVSILDTTSPNDPRPFSQSFVIPVPEPASSAMACAGIIGLAAFRRRKAA